MKERTLFMFYEIGGDDTFPFFFELEGDYSRFDGVVINGSPGSKKKSVIDAHNKLCSELTELVYQNDAPYYKVKKLKIPTRDWKWFVSCGMFV